VEPRYEYDRDPQTASSTSRNHRHATPIFCEMWAQARGYRSASPQNLPVEIRQLADVSPIFATSIIADENTTKPRRNNGGCYPIFTAISRPSRQAARDRAADQSALHP